MRGNWGAAVVLASLMVSLWSCSASECGCKDSNDPDVSVPEDQIQEDSAVPPDVAADLEPGDQRSGDQADTVPQPEDIQPMMPCLKVTPAEVHFAQPAPGTTVTYPVELSVCPGTNLPVEISEVKMAEGETFSPEFGLDLSGMGALPLVLSPGETAEFLVQFTPQEGVESSLKLAEVLILSNAIEPSIAVPVDVISADACPKAKPTIDEGNSVAPLTTVHLSGVDSFSTGATIETYSWSITSVPEGADVEMIPSQAFVAPTVKLPLAGVYGFELSVTDSKGNASCLPGTVEVVATPTQPVYVELLWDMVPDPGQEGDDKTLAADLDLHVAHPQASMPDVDGDGAPDPWFDSTYDCYKENPNPDWAAASPQGAADLLTSSTDGTWPEAVALEAGGGGAAYQVGVFYKGPSPWNPALVTVRVYVYGILVYSAKDVELNPRDMWHVCTINWPAGQVTSATNQEGEPKITPTYDNI